MLITKRIRKIDAVLEAFEDHSKIYVLFHDVEAQEERIRDLGFSVPVVVGESILPAARFGRGARRNANGYEIVHRDQPKEIKYHQMQWTHMQYHGPDLVEVTEIIDRPYLRYPRTLVPPFSVELKLYERKGGGYSVAAGPFALADVKALAALHNTIHMFVDLFGKCMIGPNVDDVYVVPTRRVNWEILPVGKRPWGETERALHRLIEHAKPSEQPVLKARFNAIAMYRPDFIATGRGGFTRYVVHGWEKQHFYLLESMEVNNATYVLKEDWEVISKLTKAEILHADAHKARLVHRKQWFGELHQLMEQNRIDRSDEDEAA